jgi:hypothetical protein
MPKITDSQLALGLLAAGAIWLFAVLPFLYGPPPRFTEPSSPPQSHTDHAGQQAAIKPDGSVTAPFFIRMPKTAKEKAEEASDRREKSSTDRWLMIFTGAVALFTLLLVGATVLLYLAGEKQLRLASEVSKRQSDDMQDSITAATIAANAASHSAEVAEQTLLASGRPMVLLELVNADNIGFPLSTIPSMDIKFVNHGSAPAILKVCFIELLDNPLTPPRLDISKLDRTYQIVGAGKEIGPMTIPVKTDNTAQAWQGDRAKRLVLHGYLEYADTLDAVHTHHIYLRLGKSAQTLTEDGGAEYNVRETSRYEAEEARDGPSRSDAHGA